MRKAVTTEGAPAAVGPYSQGILEAGFVWVSGQIPLDPATGRLVEGGIQEQTRRVLANLQAVLAAGGSGFEGVVKVTVYLTDMADFDAMNRVYAESFTDSPPARACVQVCALPKGARIEMDAVARIFT